MRTLIVVIVLLVLFVTGCTSVSYNPKTKQVTYIRVGSVKAKDILVEIDPNGVAHVEVGSTESDATEFIRKMIELGIGIGRAAP